MPRRDQSLDELQIKLPVRHDCSNGDQPLLVRKVKRTRRVPQRSKDMVFASTHHHSTFSYLDGYALPEAHVRRAAEIGMTAMALTEHGNISSHVQLEKAARKQGIKPLFGVELYCGDIGENATQRKNHLTVLAENGEGYRSLLSLVSATYADGFYYEPTADGAMLKAHRKGLVVLSGCQGSLLFTSLVGGKHVEPKDSSYARALAVARNFKKSFGGAYYIEVQAFPRLESTRRANPGLAAIADQLGIPLVATFDCHYTVPEEKELQQVLHNIRPGEKRTLEDMAREWGYSENLCPPWTDTMVVRKLIATGLTRQQAIQAVLNSREIADRCTVDLPSLPMVRYPLPEGYEDGVALWRDWLRDGWRYRGLDKLPKKEQRKYKERLLHECKIIEDKDFVDYFLIVSDAVRWAKDSGVAVGPARGSAAGSLACWLLRITEVNPVIYPDLLFERFIDVTRQDLPDIDLDFDSERRSLVRDYLVGKYGADCVSQVGTFTKFKAKNSLDDAGRVHHVPKWEIEKIKDVLIERSSGDLRASATIEDTVMQFPAAADVFRKHPDLGVAMDLEGNVKGFSTHAAGLVVSTGPITEVAAVYQRKDSKGNIQATISMDKYDAEEKGLLKLDFLGLNTMTAINKMRLGMGWELDDLYNYPLDDEEVIRGFKENDVNGIFQYEGRAMRYVNGALQPDDFTEIYIVNALSRPGPLHNGAANEYIDIKMGRKEPELLHPALENILARTKYQIVYQEQILRILQEIGDFDHTHRAEVRRIISRKIGEQEFNRRWERFYDGAKRLHDMDEETAKAIWGRCITAGSYAFNAAHCVAYSLLGYWCMMFKRHHPELFYQEALKISDEDRERILLRDTQRFGRKLEIRPPHPAHSNVTWEHEDGALRAGFTQVPGIGESIAGAIIGYREENGLTDWSELLDVPGIGPKKFSVISEFAEQPDPFQAFWLDKAIIHVKDELRKGIWTNTKKGKFRTKLPRPTHVASDLPYSTGDDIEIVWLGQVMTRNVRDLFEFNQAKGAVLDMEAMTIDGKPIKDPHLNEWCVMVGDDESDQIGLRCDRWNYPKWRNLIWRIRPGKDLVLVRGVKMGWMPTRQITIHEMWLIDPEV
jgi:DNA polymerase-3 subunit alpha